MSLFTKVKTVAAAKAQQAKRAVQSARPAADPIPAPEPPAVSDQAILALDIGTEFVNAVIAEQTDSGELKIIGIGRAHQAPTNIYAGAIADISGVVSVCEQALTQAESAAGVTSRLAVVGIAGELVKGNTSTVRYRRKNGNKPLSEHEMALIIGTIQEKLFQTRQKVSRLSGLMAM